MHTKLALYHSLQRFEILPWPAKVQFRDQHRWIVCGSRALRRLRWHCVFFSTYRPASPTPILEPRIESERLYLSRGSCRTMPAYMRNGLLSDPRISPKAASSSKTSPSSSPSEQHLALLYTMYNNIHTTATNALNYALDVGPTTRIVFRYGAFTFTVGCLLELCGVEYLFWWTVTIIEHSLGDGAGTVHDNVVRR